ncbi:MAG: hypothetical protein AABX03_00805 [Nanoarchaeota archaeon]
MTTEISIDGCVSYYHGGQVVYPGIHLLNFGRESIGVVNDDSRFVLSSLAPIFTIHSYENLKSPFRDREELDSFSSSLVRDLGLDIAYSDKSADSKLEDLEEKTKVKSSDVDHQAQKQFKKFLGKIENYVNPLIREERLSNEILLSKFREQLNHIIPQDGQKKAYDNFIGSLEKIFRDKFPKKQSSMLGLKVDDLTMDEAILRKIQEKYREEIYMNPLFLEIAEIFGKYISDEKDWIDFAYKKYS